MSTPIHEEDWDDHRVPIGSGHQLPSVGDGVLDQGLQRAVQLQEARDDLAAARADGDRIAARLMDTTVQRDQALALAAKHEMSAVEWGARCGRTQNDLDLARAELATAAAELKLLRAELGKSITAPYATEVRDV